MAADRRRVRGDRAFRKFLRNLPDAMKDEMVAMLEGVGDEIAAAQRADSSSSRIRAAITKKVYRSSMRLRVGIIGRAVARRLFFSRIIEGGRRAQTVNVTRGGRSYSMRVSPLAARPFVYNQRSRASRSISDRLPRFWDRAMDAAGQGATDD